MDSKVNYALVGGFVLLLGAASIAGILWLASGGGFQKNYDRYLALVGESVAGLNLKAAVKYRGVDVGKVTDIRLDPGNPEQVRLTFEIERGTPIKTDTEAVLKTQGLTGIAYVELDGGSRVAPLLRATVSGQYPIIHTRASLSARLENVLTTVLAKLDSTSDSINKLLSSDNLVALKSTLADLAALTHTLAARKTSIDASITNADRMLARSARVAAELAPLLVRIGHSADAIATMGTAATHASVSAANTLDAVGTDVTRFTAAAVPEIQRLLGEMNSLTVSLQRLTEETERNPRGFLFGRKPVPEGPGE